MSKYSTLIDPCDFGTIADYLRNPQSPIEYILHAKSRSMLPAMAEWLDRAFQRGCAAPEFIPRQLNYLVRAQQILISSRHPSPVLDPKALLPAANIPRSAFCEVLYLPPFYLVHTPGLFEGTLIRPKTELKPNPNLRRNWGSRMKI